jgi:xanthine dehydrogenase accessory factor
MPIGALYAELLDVLESEGQAVVSSAYRADGTVKKAVISPADDEAWAEAERLMALPEATADGPVTTLSADDGSMEVFESYTTKPRLIILGGGHIALALVEMAKLMDFEALVYDDRPSFANPQRFPQADLVICDGFDRLFERVQIKRTDYVVIVTRGHRHDAECLEGLLSGLEPTYTGMIGSKRRVAIVMQQMKDKGYDTERLSKVHSPIGLSIGAVTPAEIALSIMAEAVQVKRVENNRRSDLSCEVEVVQALAGRDTAADALITILRTEGSVPIGAGAKLSMTYEGTIIGTIGGGCSEADAMQVAREVIREGGWRVHGVDMTDTAESDGMVCGGTMHVVIERVDSDA